MKSISYKCCKTLIHVPAVLLICISSFALQGCAPNDKAADSVVEADVAQNKILSTAAAPAPTDATSTTTNQNITASPQATAATSSPYKIGAYYFGMFGNQAKDPNFSTIDVNGYKNSTEPDLWWRGVRDLFLGRSFNTTFLTGTGQDKSLFNSWRAGDFSHLKPAIGFYDQANKLTLEKHIQQASENGLSYFAFYWYWTPRPTLNGRREAYSDGLDSFLKARNTTSMEFMLSMCEHGWQFSLPNDQFNAAADKLVEYFQKPNYLKIEGRPAFQLCDVKGIHWSSLHPNFTNAAPTVPIDQSAVNAFITILKDKTFAKMGVHPFTTARSDDPDTYSLPVVKNHSDAAQCLMANSMTPGTSLYDYYYTAEQVANKNINFAQGKRIMPCLTQNFDERPRMGSMSQILAEFGLKQGFVPNYSAGNFQWGLTKIKQWMDAQTDVASKHLTIYAWNEWHEGGIIEPNSKNGSAKLEAINVVFGLPKGTNPCRTTGLCTGEPPYIAPPPPPPPPPLATADIYRMIYTSDTSIGYLVTQTLQEGLNYNYTHDATFKVYANPGAGFHAIYRCYSPTIMRFVSASATCEGAGSNEGVLGYLSDTNTGGLRQIYRLVTGANRRLISYDPTEGAGWTSYDGPLGYGP